MDVLLGELLSIISYEFVPISLLVYSYAYLPAYAPAYSPANKV